MRDYAQCTAVITGAASGIGYGLAVDCASRHMRVVLSDIDSAALIEATRALGSQGSACTAFRADVAIEADVRALAEFSARTLVKIDFLFINAGVNVLGYVWEYDTWDWRWIIDVNLWGMIHCLMSFLPLMMTQDAEAFVVFTSSGGAFLPFQTAAPYNATKSAIIAVAETLYNELLITKSRIKLRVVCPAMVKTSIDKAETHRQELYRNPAVDYGSQSRRRRWIPHSAVEAGASVKEVVQAVFASFDKDEFYVFPQPDVKAAIAEKLGLVISKNLPLDLSRGMSREAK